MAKSLLSSLKKKFGASSEEQAVPAPDLSRVLKPSLPKASRVAASETPPSSLEPEQSSEEIQESWLSADVSALRDALAAFRQEPNRPATRRTLFLCAHNLRGAAEPLGNPDVARLATSLCRLIESCGSAESDLNLANLHVRAIGAAAAGEDGSDASSAVCVALEDSVRNRRAGRRS